MLEKYKATIYGDRIVWDADVPESVKTHESVGVYVIEREQSAELPKTDSKKVVAILQEIADRGGLVTIKDPVKWQRNIRKDRSLPGR